MKLGINSMGRIGKLSVWHHAGRKQFSELVVNLGRDVGMGLSDVAQVLEKDSSYGQLESFLHGFRGGRVIENLDEKAGTMTIDGVPVRILREQRNPKDIPWRDHDVRLVVDCTGVFNDPTVEGDAKWGSMRGHLDGGAEKVLLSAPFKIKNKALPMPDDAVTCVMGINEEDYEPSKHQLISAASCTTTCLSHMIKPLLDQYGVDRILSASMVTVHAATGSQKVLDAVPKAGKADLRKSRSILNNIILTTTGAAKALQLVIPEVQQIGFMAESCRVPTSTGSLTILTVNLQSEDRNNPINRSDINGIFEAASTGAYKGYLAYTEKQNVSSDIIGFPKAATIIEATETHTRTAYTRFNIGAVPGIPDEVKASLGSSMVEVPVTQAVIYGWYDNELGSYTNMLADLTSKVADTMI
ncbi:MAG: glyceraldehyde-3-phosphate dehydrogenase [Magnetococcales bacterium]|nr:glyceraldehyde-3-phosphate dehydrogenase [Magnetococcales bacterium]